MHVSYILSNSATVSSIAISAFRACMPLAPLRSFASLALRKSSFCRRSRRTLRKLLIAPKEFVLSTPLNNTTRISAIHIQNFIRDRIGETSGGRPGSTFYFPLCLISGCRPLNNLFQHSAIVRIRRRQIGFLWVCIRIGIFSVSLLQNDDARLLRYFAFLG
jgi:hypothetical protein